MIINTGIFFINNKRPYCSRDKFVIVLGECKDSSFEGHFLFLYIMVHEFHNRTTGGKMTLISQEAAFEHSFFGKDKYRLCNTFAWNRGYDQTIIIDEARYPFPSQSIVPLMLNQTFHFDKSEDIVAWQFNRDFYCIINHDAEVGCVGFLFFGNAQIPFVQLNEKEIQKFEALLKVFYDEFEVDDTIKEDMLQMLLKRLIIKITRLAKEQVLNHKIDNSSKLNTIREFNLLVEMNFRRQHSVQFYASEMTKSPKTLSNLFALYNHQTPLEIIQNRVILEAKRLLTYTEKSSKEISTELGFEDPSHFSRFFKNKTSLSPSGFKSKESFAVRE